MITNEELEQLTQPVQVCDFAVKVLSESTEYVDVSPFTVERVSYGLGLIDEQGQPTVLAELAELPDHNQPLAELICQTANQREIFELAQDSRLAAKDVYDRLFKLDLPEETAKKVQAISQIIKQRHQQTAEELKQYEKLFVKALDLINKE